MKQTSVRRLLLVMAMSLAIVGCTSPAAPVQLAGRTFLSTGVRDGDADRPLVPGTRVRLTFQDGSNLGVNAGCNHLGGTYRLEGGILVFQGGGMTEMGCDEPRHAQDEWIATFLGARPTVALAGQDLVLTSGATTIRLLDEEAADPDRPLEGTLWTVDTILDGDTAASLPGDVAANFQFAEDGTVAIQTGCNQGGATVVTDGATLRFGDIMLTKRACDGPGGAMEAAVLEVLRGAAVGYEIDAGRLTLMSGTRGLGLRASD